MKTNLEFKLIRRSTPYDFEVEVNEALCNNWRLQGLLFYDGCCFCQAMVRRANSKQP